MPPGLTVNEGVQELISEYHAVLPPTVTMDETDMLLAALLMELKAQRLSGGDTETADIIIEQQRADYADGSDATRGTYHSEEVTAPPDDWEEIDLDFTASEVDLRNISGSVKVAFADPTTGDTNTIPYDDSDSPVAGINVQTGRLWFRSDSGADETLNVEAWV